MSPASPQSFDIHVPKQRQIKQEEDQDERNRLAQGKDSQTQRESSDASTQRETIAGHKRQRPWPEPVAVFQPRLESSSSHARSIGVHSILNPTEGGDSQQQQVKRSSSAAHQEYNMEILPPPPTLPPSPQRRSSSSPLLAPISRSANAKSYLQHAHGRSSVSPPHNPPRRIITPVSPAMRYASSTGGNNNIANAGSAGVTCAGTGEAKVRVSQAPFVPLQELSAGVYSTPGSGPGSTPPIIEPFSSTTTTTAATTITSRFSPKLAIPVPRRNHQPPPPPSLPLSISRHSTPTLIHSRHPSGGLATNPSSTASSPSTPQSTFSSFAQSSPSIASGLLPPPGQASSVESQSPYMGMDSLSRTPSRMSDHHATPFPGPLDTVAQNNPHPPHHQQQQQQQYNMPMIPVTIDMKSGSRSQAEKRKANSDASRRFRNRKKNEAALEQRISQLNEQLACMTEERDFYRTERNFFRDSLGRHVGVTQMPSRPSSPSPSRRYPAGGISSSSSSSSSSTTTATASPAMMGGEDMSKSVSTSSSLASTHILASPDSLPSSATGHSSAYADSWQNGSTTPAAANAEYYREDHRFAAARRS